MVEEKYYCSSLHVCMYLHFYFSSLPYSIIIPDGGTAARRDAVTMSWKYAAMEIYGLLSDVRDTDAEEMNVS